MSLEALQARDHEVGLASELVSVLYRRSSEFPARRVNTHCINDIRLRLICTDKLLCNHVLLERLPHLPVPQTLPFTSRRRRSTS